MKSGPLSSVTAEMSGTASGVVAAGSSDENRLGEWIHTPVSCRRHPRQFEDAKGKHVQKGNNHDGNKGAGSRFQALSVESTKEVSVGTESAEPQSHTKNKEISNGNKFAVP